MMKPISKYLKEFEELRPDMQVTTQVEPRLLNEDKVKHFLKQALLNQRKEIIKEIEEKMKRYRNAKYSTDSMTILTRRWKELKKDILKELKE